MSKLTAKKRCLKINKFLKSVKNEKGEWAIFDGDKQITYHTYSASSAWSVAFNLLSFPFEIGSKVKRKSDGLIFVVHGSISHHWLEGFDNSEKYIHLYNWRGDFDKYEVVNN